MTRNNAAAELAEQLKTKANNLQVKEIPFQNSKAYICYFAELVDRRALSEFVIKPLIDAAQKGGTVNAAHAKERILYADDCTLGQNLAEVEPHVLNGRTVILFSNDAQFVIVNCKQVQHRAVSPPELMYAARGPRDAFVEPLDVNLSLLRYRLKDDNLQIEKKQVGARTKSTVAITYLTDVVNPAVVQEVNKRIDRINTDGIYETGELQGYLLDKKNALFPQMGIIERSDMAVEKLLEGKVVILVDGSNTAIYAPAVFAEFLYSCDDRYDSKFFGLFMRVIRYLAVIFCMTLSAGYVALAEFHPDALPASYIVTFAQMRARAPFSPLIAIVTIELIVELMREALLRVPVKIGSAIGIVGAIIIGQAAISSGVYTALTLILVSISFLSTFAIPDFTLVNTLRILKFLVILLTGFFGFFGFSLAITVILTIVVSVDSFGVPYTAPWAPYNGYDFGRFMMFSKRSSPFRQQYMRDNDDTRTPRAHRMRKEGKGPS